MRISPPVSVVVSRSCQKVGVSHLKVMLLEKGFQSFVKSAVKFGLGIRIDFEITFFAKAKKCLHRRVHGSGKKFRQGLLVRWQHLSMPGMPGVGQASQKGVHLLK